MTFPVIVAGHNKIVCFSLLLPCARLNQSMLYQHALIERYIKELMCVHDTTTLHVEQWPFDKFDSQFDMPLASNILSLPYSHFQKVLLI